MVAGCLLSLPERSVLVFLLLGSIKKKKCSECNNAPGIVGL